MSTDTKSNPTANDTSAKAAENPHKGIKKDFHFKAEGSKLAFEYQVDADWMPIYKGEKVAAEMFFVAYTKKGEDKTVRPITFVFNGGPGASSVYLHIGALGPKRVAFSEVGGLIKPPSKMVDNTETWLQFTDLVFVDPVGTGFSRIKKPEKSEGGGKDGAKGGAGPADDEKVKPHEFYQLNSDLDSLGELIQRVLARLQRWSSPLFIAGESYGGFRVAKLARRLQEKFGVGLNGAILISPALEVSLLNGNDYDVGMWVDTFPSMAASNYFHKHGADKLADFEQFRTQVEDFATSSLVSLMLRGDIMSQRERDTILLQAAEYLGLKNEYITLKQGRVSISEFSREYLRKEGKVCGIYDASITTYDPFPDRESFHGPDPTLFSIDRVFTGGINHHLREHLGVETPHDYRILSFDVFMNWGHDEKRHLFDSPVGATDDLRYGMSLNPQMKVFICHGYYDLVTPYYASKRISSLMRLDAHQKQRMSLKNYNGGHMFYTWDKSRKEFENDIKAFVTSAL